MFCLNLEDVKLKGDAAGIVISDWNSEKLIKMDLTLLKVDLFSMK